MNKVLCSISARFLLFFFGYLPQELRIIFRKRKQRKTNNFNEKFLLRHFLFLFYFHAVNIQLFFCTQHLYDNCYCRPFRNLMDINGRENSLAAASQFIILLLSPPASPQQSEYQRIVYNEIYKCEPLDYLYTPR